MTVARFLWNASFFPQGYQTRMNNVKPRIICKSSCDDFKSYGIKLKLFYLNCLVFGFSRFQPLHNFGAQVILWQPIRKAGRPWPTYPTFLPPLPISTLQIEWSLYDERLSTLMKILFCFQLSYPRPITRKKFCYLWPKTIWIGNCKLEKYNNIAWKFFPKFGQRP